MIRRCEYFTKAMAEASEVGPGAEDREEEQEDLCRPKSAAREHLKTAKDQFLADPTKERKEIVEVIEEELCTAYTEAREDM